MRPRINGKAAYLMRLLRKDEEPYKEVFHRHISNPPDETRLLKTITEIEFGEAVDPGMVRPRLGGAADEVEARRAEDEDVSTAITRLLTPAWEGFDIENFTTFSKESSDRYVQAVREFKNWYEEKGRIGPPTAYDASEWLALQRDQKGFSEGTRRLYYFAIRAWARFECGEPIGRESEESHTREELLAALRDFAADLGRTPTAKQIHNSPEYPGIHEYQNEFGSWNEALEAAGYDLNQKKTGRYTDEELIDSLRSFAAEIGEVPTSTQMAEHGPHSTSTYIDHFGTWLDALREADLYEEKYGTNPQPAG